jgi:VWFA-related protein
MAMDLRRDNFRLSEQGIVRPISVFIRNWMAEDIPAPVPASRFGRFSNSLQQQAPANLNIVLLDQLDTGWQDWERAWPDVLRFVEGLGPTERIAIYLLDAVNGLRVLQDIGDDPRRLGAALEKLSRPTLAALLQAAPAPDYSGEPSFAQRGDGLQRPELISLGGLRGLTNALNAIADHLAGMPGRKTLIWFAGVFPDPFPKANLASPALLPYRSRMLEAVNHLRSNNVGIYPIDARGLMPDHSFDAENRGLPIGPVGRGQSNSLQVYDFSAVMELARRSGGKAYFNTNGFAQSLRDAAFAERSSYTLGFYLSGEPDGKYHSIKVWVDRPQIRLRYRRGYWAFPVTQRAGEGATQRQLRAALESPFMDNSIQLQADAKIEARDPVKAQVVVYINPGNLSFEREGKSSDARLDVLIGQKDAAGRGFAIPPYSVPLSVADSLLASRGWLETQAAVTLRPGATSIRIVVRDQVSGMIGSVDIPLKELSH